MSIFEFASDILGRISNFQTLIAAVIGTFIAWRFNERKSELDEKAFKRDLFCLVRARSAQSAREFKSTKCLKAAAPVPSAFFSSSLLFV